MKTLLFTLEYPPFKGGVANYYGNLVKYWPKDGDIEVLNLTSSRRPFGWLKAAVKLRQAVKTKKIDHILVGQILPLGTAALICSKLCKIKYSVVLHGLDFTCATKSFRKKFVSKHILAGAEKIICANTYVASLASQTFPNIASKVAVVNPGVEDRTRHDTRQIMRLKNKYNLQNKIILLSVGRLVKRKGFDKVIEAMPKILKQVPDLIYVIIGDGEELNNYQRQIVNYGLKNQVIIINRATDDERDDWYETSDIFIMPARNIDGDFEGFGIVYLEANLAGKPVIAGKSGGVEDAVIDGLNGLLVDPEKVNDISEKIIKLALDTNLRNKLGRLGQKRAIKDFNWRKQAEKMYNIIA